MAISMVLGPKPRDAIPSSAIIFPFFAAGVRYSDIYFTNGSSLPISETVEEVKDLIDVAL